MIKRVNLSMRMIVIHVYSSLQALSLKTMIHPTLGNFRALELFWESVL